MTFKSTSCASWINRRTAFAAGLAALCAPAARARATDLVRPPRIAGAHDMKIIARDGVLLAGTLHRPTGPGPFPVLIFAHGSDALPRGREFEVVGAQRFVDAGVAILFTDKRGVGDTPGVYVESSDLFAAADDVVAQARHLKGLGDFCSIGVFGVSRGGWVAPIAASRSADIDFLVILSGPAVSPNETNIFARAEEARDQGVSEAEVQAVVQYRRVLWRYYGTGEGYEAAMAAWRAAKDRPWYAGLMETGEPLAPARLGHPALSYFRIGAYDPAPTLASLRIPVLMIYGEKDRLIPARQSAAVARQALSRNRRARVVTIPGAGHGMRLVVTREALRGQPPGPLTWAPTYWPTVTDWLARNVRCSRPA